METDNILQQLKVLMIIMPWLPDIDSSMWEGEFILRSDKGRPYAIPGVGVAQYLGIRVNFITPLNIYVPRKTGSINHEC